MRTANLVFLILFAAASCDMRISSRSAVAQTAAAASAPASLPKAAAQPDETGANICGYSFEAASPEETASFLRELSGQWRDELSAPVLVEGSALVDGLFIDDDAIIPVRLPVEGGGNVALPAKPDALAVGPVGADGFRVVQLSMTGEPSCVVYALKIERPGGTTLLVRGPLSPMGSRALPAAAFQADTYDSTRLFSRL